MSDLDLVPFTDPSGPHPGAERSRNRPGRHRRRKQAGDQRGRTLIAAGVVLVVLSGVVFGAWWGVGKVRSFFTAEDHPGPGTGEAIVVIRPGNTVTEIGNTLFKAKVVASAQAFVDAAEDEPKSQNLQPGTYRLRQEMKAADALALLLDPASKVEKTVLIREGLTVIEILQTISKETGLPLADLKAAAADPVALGVPEWAGPSPDKRVLEGFLFPATYPIDAGETAVGLLTRMVKKSLEVMEKDNLVGRAQALGLTPWDLLKVASLVEQEGIEKDFDKIARVVYNRLEADMVLQFDSTTQYWLIQTGQGRKKIVTNAELRNPANNYSTTLNKGLPPTPISNPGQVAVAAAAEPADGDWLFFVVTGTDGSSSFAVTDAEHEQNKVKCRQIGRC